MAGLQPVDFEVARNGSGTPTSVLVADRTSAALGGLYFATGWNAAANGGTGAFSGAATQILSGTAIQAALGGPAVNGLSQIVVSGADVYAVTVEPLNAGQFGNNRIIKASFANGFASANTGISLVATAGTSREFQGIEMLLNPLFICEVLSPSITWGV